MSFVIPLIMASLAQDLPKKYATEYSEYEYNLAKMEPLKQLVAFNLSPSKCHVGGNVPQHTTEKTCEHVIIGDFPNERVIQVFTNSPYNSFFLFADKVGSVNSEFVYNMNKMDVDGQTVKISGKCTESVITPDPWMHCTVKGEGVTLSVDFDMSDPYNIK